MLSSAQTVVYEKAVDGKFYVVEAVLDTKAKTAFVVSAYMQKRAGTSLQTTDESTSAQTAQSENAVGTPTPKISVSQERGKVNRTDSMSDHEGNPQIYRWNYFYTPVQIGDDVVGVRIAVCDRIPSYDRRALTNDIMQAAADGRLMHLDKKEANQFLLGVLRPIRRVPYKRLTSIRTYRTSGQMSSGKNRGKLTIFRETTEKTRRRLPALTRKRRERRTLYKQRKNTRLTRKNRRSRRRNQRKRRKPSR